MVINGECCGWVQGDDNGSPVGGGGGGGVEVGPMGEEVEAMGAAEREGVGEVVLAGAASREP